MYPREPVAALVFVVPLSSSVNCSYVTDLKEFNKSSRILFRLTKFV